MTLYRGVNAVVEVVVTALAKKWFGRIIRLAKRRRHRIGARTSCLRVSQTCQRTLLVWVCGTIVW